MVGERDDAGTLSVVNSTHEMGYKKNVVKKKKKSQQKNNINTIAKSEPMICVRREH